MTFFGPFFQYTFFKRLGYDMNFISSIFDDYLEGIEQEHAGKKAWTISSLLLSLHYNQFDYT